MKKLFLFVLVTGLSILLSSCTKDSVPPSAGVNIFSKSNSNTGTGSEGVTATTTVPATPTINDVNLQGKWTVQCDSSYWAGETGKNLVSAYTGKQGDSFNFSKNGKLYINEEAGSDTTSYSVAPDSLINVTYADSKHFNEAPGFALNLGFKHSDGSTYVYFTQTYADANTLILNSFIGTPGGISSRVIYLKR